MRMADSAFYVRSKGRITGPFDLAGLQKMVRRGLVSRFDEISSDKRSWSGAGEFEDLFPSRAGAAVAAPVAAVAASAPMLEEARLDGITRFFYSQGGKTVGP